VDQVMLMAVNPGYAGQAFIEAVLQKAERLRSLIDGGEWQTEIEIDGGISTATAPRCVAAGADVLVAASAVFSDKATVTENMAALTNAIRGVSPRE